MASEVETAAILLYYAYMAFGAVSVGYLVIKAAGKSDDEEKVLGMSAIAGFAVVITAVIADYLFNGFAPFIAALIAVAATALVGAVSNKQATPMPAPAALAGAVSSKQASPAAAAQMQPLHKPAEPQKIETRTEKAVAPLKLQEDEQEKDEIKKKLDELRKKGFIPGTKPQEQPPAPPATPQTEKRRTYMQQEPKKEGAKEEGRKPGELSVRKDEWEERRVLRKAKETELETIVSDIAGELDETSEDSGRHRLYLKKDEPTQQQSKRHRQYAKEKEEKKDELAQLVTDVYVPLKKEQELQKKEEDKKKTEEEKKKTDDRKAAAGKKEERKEGGKTIAAPTASKELSMADLFGEEKKPATAEPGVCPNCKAKTTRVVTCPYCGAEMCAACTPSVMPSPEGFTYTCRSCGEEIPVKKKQTT